MKLVLERRPINNRRPTTTLTLSEERGKQIRDIATKHNISITKLITRFINSEIRKGTILDEIPGYKIKRVGKVIQFSIGKTNIAISADEALEFSDKLKEIACEPSHLAYSRIRDRKTEYASYGLNWVETKSSDILIKRRGRGLIITLGRIRRTLAPDVALDLVRLIRAAAKKAARC